MLTLKLVVALAVTGAGEPQLLDFCASWCGPCQMMSPTVDRLAQNGFSVRKIDIDREPGLASRYGVESVPTFVVVVDGQERGRVVGATNYARLQQLLNANKPKPTSPARSASGGRKPPGALRRINAPNRLAKNQPTHIGRLPKTDRLPADKALASRLRKATVRLRIEEPDGHSFGSGTIIDMLPAKDGRSAEALVLTCGHLFRDSKGTGSISVDLFDPRHPRTLKGHLVRYDLKRDIGLVSILIDAPVEVARLADKSDTARKGDPVLNIGCSDGRAATVEFSRVMAINSFVGPPNLQVAGQPEVGRSGGGLFNRRGELIGVCNFADPTDKAGLYAAGGSVCDVLDGAGLAGIYNAQASLAAVASRERASNGTPPNMASTMPSTVSPLNVTANPAPIGKTASGATVMPATAVVESTPVAGPEVICIVRPAGVGKEDARVIVIQNASAELLEQIAAAQQSRQGSFQTSKEVPKGSIIPGQ